MKLTRCHLENFCSYSSLDFDFSSLGLALIHGATGSGKSTLQDAPAWILFGVTAKDGGVDEVRSWQTPDLPTTGTLEVELQDGTIEVTRVRGKVSQNDLYWTEDGKEEKHRGKDNNETQKLLCSRLGITGDGYVQGSYFHEFSPSAGFFVAKAKDRRTLFEGIANLELPAALFQAATEARKNQKGVLAEHVSSLDRLSGKIEQLNSGLARVRRDAVSWDNEQTQAIETLKGKAKTFNQDREAKITRAKKLGEEWQKAQDAKLDQTLDRMEELQVTAKCATKDIEAINIKLEEINKSKCSKCGAATGHEKKEELTAERRGIERALEEFNQSKRLLQELADAINPADAQIASLEALENNYEAQAKQEATRCNPHKEAIAATLRDIGIAEVAEVAQKAEVEKQEHRLAGVERLQALSSNLRGELVKKAVYQVQESTNKYLEAYFDSELKVEFSLEGSDSLQVAIEKNGYTCTYKQLSKGQRQMLRLCFSLSIMKASADKTGVHFDCLMLDESLDGLDTALKVKAFSLFQELQKDHGTVLVIDHSTELKELFDVKYHVTLNGDISTIEQEE